MQNEQKIKNYYLKSTVSFEIYRSVLFAVLCIGAQVYLYFKAAEYKSAVLGIAILSSLVFAFSAVIAIKKQKNKNRIFLVAMLFVVYASFVCGFLTVGSFVFAVIVMTSAVGSVGAFLLLKTIERDLVKEKQNNASSNKELLALIPTTAAAGISVAASIFLPLKTLFLVLTVIGMLFFAFFFSFEFIITIRQFKYQKDTSNDA